MNVTELALPLALRTALCLVGALVVAGLLRRSSAALRERVLTLALAAVLLLPAAVVLFPAFELPVPRQMTTAARAVAAPRTVAASDPHPVAGAPSADGRSNAPSGSTRSASVDPAHEARTTTRLPASVTTSRAAAGGTFWIRSAPLLVWLAVSSLLLARLVAQRVRLAARARAGVAAGPDWRVTIRRVAAELGLRS
ncbi:MAG: hypothetical protein ACREI7_11270, partial [Myxococcota bacterium]